VKRFGVVLAIVALAVVAVTVGRRERSHFVAAQNRHLRELFAAVGGIDARTIASWRPDAANCFWYAAGGKRYGISLCFDGEGRLVSGADRRSGSAVYWDLGRLSSRAAVRVPSGSIAALNRKLRRLQVELASTP
jgi:hypothetical protein